MIQILLVEDQDLIRCAVRNLLEEQGLIEVVGECGSGEAALEYCRSHPLPNVILMDLHMPGIGGIEAARRLLKDHPNARILILTGQTEGPLPRHLMDSGAYGYITKNSQPEEMQRAISEVHHGRRYLSQDEAQRLALDSQSSINNLSPRELEMLLQIARGATNREIQKQMGVSPKTISTYRTRLMEKLDVRTDVELARVAQQHGLCQFVASATPAAQNE